MTIKGNRGSNGRMETLFFYYPYIHFITSSNNTFVEGNFTYYRIEYFAIQNFILNHTELLAQSIVQHYMYYSMNMNVVIE